MSAPVSRMVTLLYHDVVEPGAEDRSGFPGGVAGSYKLTITAFEQHLAALAAAGLGAPALVGGAGGRWMLHFDDAGQSALTVIAPRLQQLGWRGNFFVPTRYIGTEGFLDADGVRELYRRGHVVGSHSWSHPERISGLARGQIVEEWRRSRGELESLLRAPITVASVPGGFYSRRVARAAAEAGLRLLFNSEPVLSVREVAGIEVRGRYSVNRRTRPPTAAGLARGRLDPRLSQYLLWNLKKLGKNLARPLYRRLREGLLGP